MKHACTVFLLFFIGTAAFGAPLTGQEVQWLNRIGYGISSQSVDELQSQGKKTYLDRQLAAPANGDDRLPAPIASLIASLSIEQKGEALIAEQFQKTHQAFKTLPEEQKQAIRKAKNQSARQLLNETVQRHLWRALHSPWQLKQQVTWFWLNHFNVYHRKADIGALLADYEDTAIHPHALGKFRDLLMATVRHPAMLIYLDNTHNAAGKLNENYARELMELHTMGVGSGYTQQDVQELARILTGVGVNWTDTQPKMRPALHRYYLREGAFEFNPKRHDFGEKRFLGTSIPGEGFAEVERVIDLLANHPATAKFISHKLAVYFVCDNPSPALVDKVAATFTASGGDIAASLRSLLESQEFTASLGKKVSHPMHYIVSAIRLAYDGQLITQTDPIVHWLNKLDQPLYGHPTPDGYGMTEKDWISPAQLTERFAVAKQIVNSQLSPSSAHGSLKQQKLAERPLFKTLETRLSAQTKTALAKAQSAQEWNTFLLSAPEFLYR